MIRIYLHIKIILQKATTFINYDYDDEVTIEGNFEEEDKHSNCLSCL